MDSDAVIGRLYRELEASREANNALIALVTNLKSGELSLDRIEVTPTGITLSAVPEAKRETA